MDEAATVTLPGSDDYPLLVVLHGYGANEADLVPVVRALGWPGGAVSLRGPISLGPQAWAWFPLAITPGRNLGSVAEDVVTAGSAVVDYLATHAAGKDVVLLGFSQGGATCLEVMQRIPDHVRCCVVLSGFIVPTSSTADTGHIPTFFGHGDADQVIPAPLTQATSTWLSEHASVTDRSYPGMPHAVGQAEITDVRRFLAPLVLTPDSAQR